MRSATSRCPPRHRLVTTRGFERERDARTFAAGDYDHRMRLISGSIVRSVDHPSAAEAMKATRNLASSRARVCQHSAHQCSVVASCDVGHGWVATTWRARSIASIRIAISGRPTSSRVKFGAGLLIFLPGRRHTQPGFYMRLCGNDHAARIMESQAEVLRFFGFCYPGRLPGSKFNNKLLVQKLT